MILCKNVLNINMKQNRTENTKHPANQPWINRSAKCSTEAASVTHLAAGVLAGGLAAFPPLLGAGGVGAGALVTAAACRPCPGLPLPFLSSRLDHTGVRRPFHLCWLDDGLLSNLLVLSLLAVLPPLLF